jgi:hypothetical protein
MSKRLPLQAPEGRRTHGRQRPNNIGQGSRIAAHLIEHQLAQVMRDPLGRAYNRMAHLHERRKMMQEWAGYLDVLKTGPNTRTARSLREELRLSKPTK